MIKLSSTIIKTSLFIMFILSFGSLYSKNYSYSELQYGHVFRIPELGCVYLPSSYTPNKKYPLMVVLYPPFGFTDNNFIISFIEEAEKREIIVIAPKDYDGYRRDPDTQRIKQMVVEIKKKFSIDSRRVLLYGFSAGGSFTHEVVITNKDNHGEKYITAYCAVSGGAEYNFEHKFIKKDKMPDNFKIPAYLIWGAKEESHSEKEVADFLLKKGWDVTVRIHDGGHYIPDGSIAQVLDWFQTKCND